MANQAHSPNSTGSLQLPDTSVWENRDNYLKWAVPLYQASISSDWKSADDIISQRGDLVRFALNTNCDTALHAAVTAIETERSLQFVNELVKRMTIGDLELKNRHANTAFWVACESGKMEMAMIMMKKNPKLQTIRGKDEDFPLSISAKAGRYNLVNWLYNRSGMSGAHLADSDWDSTLLDCAENDMFVIANRILKDRRVLAPNVSLLDVLSRKHSALNKRLTANPITTSIRLIMRKFNGIAPSIAEEGTNAQEVLTKVWEHATRTMSFDEIEIMLKGPSTSLASVVGGTIVRYSSRMLFVAAERGNTRFIVELLRTYPELMLTVNDHGHTIFHIAVMHRHEDIYSLLYEAGNYKNEICRSYDDEGNNMLHLVGKKAKEMADKIYGGAIVMQQEIIWFKAVETMMPSDLREAKNKDGKTPSELFYENNEYLISGGLNLMKDCMLITAIIVTVAFAIAFTVPGGYDQDDGIPILIQQNIFSVFIIADAISLMTSSGSLILFLSVLASSGNQRALMDKLSKSLPTSISLIFLSVAAMLITFSASLFMLYPKRLTWVPVIVAAYAGGPIIISLQLQYPIFAEIFRSTYASRYMFKPKKRMLYTKNPAKP